MPRPFKVQYQSKAWAKSDRKHFDEDVNCGIVEDMANDRKGNTNEACDEEDAIGDKLHWHWLQCTHWVPPA